MLAQLLTVWYVMMPLLVQGATLATTVTTVPLAHLSAASATV